MSSSIVSVDEQIADASMGRPHLVILGAGASLAAFPNGDRYGRQLPLMHDLISKLGLEGPLSEHGVHYEGENFESVYSKLYSDGSNSELIDLVNERVRDYFSLLELPDEPTLYDHLVLSLRAKDTIATFNWDPFLFDACERNHGHADLPYTVYLHGNVRIGYCLKDMRRGMVGRVCGACGQPYVPSSLLYPVEQKDYSTDEAIQHEWNVLRDKLQSAFVVTIFGYSAPVTDAEAVDLMSDAWGNPEGRQFEEVEIIDIKGREELRATWDRFIHTHHFRVYDSFYDSLAATYPRRVCESMRNMLLRVRPVEANEIPRHVDFSALRSWLKPLVVAEQVTQRALRRYMSNTSGK